MKRFYLLSAALGILLSLAAVSFSEDYAKDSPEDVAVRFSRHLLGFETREAMALVVAGQQADIDWQQVETWRKEKSFQEMLLGVGVLQRMYDFRKTDSRELSPDKIELTFEGYTRDIEQLSLQNHALWDIAYLVTRRHPVKEAEIQQLTAHKAELEQAVSALPFKEELEGFTAITLVRENGAWRVESMDSEKASKMALILYPEASGSPETEHYNNRARMVGWDVELAEELYFQNAGGDIDGRYSASLEDLLIWNKNLTDDPGITFIFGPCNASGYTFTTSHIKGDKPFKYRK